MMQLNRKALFEHLAAEEDDLSLKAYRALAAELKFICMSARWRCAPFYATAIPTLISGLRTIPEAL